MTSGTELITPGAALFAAAVAAPGICASVPLGGGSIRFIVKVDCNTAERGTLAPGRISPAGMVLAAAVLFAGCQHRYFPDYHLIHPHEPPAKIVAWSDTIEADGLQVRVEGALPPGEGPFPVVLVHPPAGRTAVDMRGLIWDLAEHDFMAVAADYRRRIDGEFRRTLFAWRNADDPLVLLDAVVRDSHADPSRIHAVVAYYPVTDFEY